MHSPVSEGKNLSVETVGLGQSSQSKCRKGSVLSFFAVLMHFVTRKLYLKSLNSPDKQNKNRLFSASMLNQSSLTPLILILIAVFLPIQAGATIQWSPTTGPAGGSVQSIAIDPATPTTLYVPTGTGGVFKSTDGGANWVAVNTGQIGQDITYIVVDPINPSILYTGGTGGVYKSTNSGNSWIPSGTGLPGWGTSVIVIDPISPSTLYVIAGQVLIYKSTDSGNSWTLANTGLPIGTIYNITIDPNNTSTLYASTVSGAFKSVNGGKSWVAANLGLAAGWVASIIIDPVNPLVIYAETWNGLLKSTNGGNSWRAVSIVLTGGGARSLTIDPITPSNLYVNGVDGIYKSTNSGNSWVAANTGLPPVWMLHSIAVDPIISSTVYVATDIGMYKSTNGGNSWISVNTGMKAWGVSFLAVDSINPSTVYAVSGPWGSKVFKSSDSGSSWVVADAGLPGLVISNIVIDQKKTSTLYVAMSGGGGVYKSINSGKNWVAVNTGLINTYITSLAIDPLTPSRLYASAPGTGVYISTNGGNSWVVSNTGLPLAGLGPIAVDPIAPLNIYVITGSGLYKSTDSGNSWGAANLTPGNTTISSIAIDPITPGTLYVGTDGGVFKSADGGVNWTATNTGLGFQNIFSIAIDPVIQGTLYVGTSVGVFQSKDSGANWVAVNTGLAKTHIQSLTIAPVSPTTLYAGRSYGGGVFKGVDVAAITNFTVIDNPTSGLDFTVNLSAPLPAGYTLAVNFDNQQGGWLFQSPGWSVPLTKGLNGTTYTLNRVMNKPGLRSYRIGIFDPNSQLVGNYSQDKTCLTATCLATIERTNNIGNPSSRGSQTFKNVDVASGNYHFVSTDMSVPSKGPSFNLTRSYNSLGMQSVIKGTNLTNPNPLTMKDYNVKPNPWTFAHDMQARFMNDQLETGLAFNTNRKIILGPMEDGSLLYYFKDMDQKWYTLTPGNFKQLIQNTNGSFTLYSQGDRIYQFADPAGVAKGRLNRIENRAGLALTYHYNVINILTSVTDANNHSYTFAHGVGGKTLRVTDFTGRFVEYTFNANGMITQVRNMRGKFYKYTYGTTGSNIYRIATIKDPRNTVTAQLSLIYENIIGRVLSLVDGAGNVTGFQYGTAKIGTPLKAQPATGITRPRVDNLNHNLVYILDTARSKVKKRIDAKSYAQGFKVAATDIVTTHTYNVAANRKALSDNTLVIKTVDPNKTNTDIAYDPTMGGGRPQTVASSVGSGLNKTVLKQATATYANIPNQINLKPITSVLQSGVVSATKYQTFTATGKAQDIIDPKGNKTTRAFDANDQLVATTNPRQTANPALGSTQYVYYPNGYVHFITDALGNKITKTYDLLGRVKTELSPLGLTTTYTYDANGNVLTRIEQGAGGINYKTTNTYDANDNLLSTTDPLLHVTNYTFDNLNRKTKESYTVGGVPYVRSFTYDPIGRLATVTNERGFATQTHYTSRSQVKYKIDPLLNTTVTYTYDKNGNVTTVKDAENRIVTTTYDALNRKTQTVDPKGNTQKWTYNPAGQIATYTDARLKVTSYLYDAVGNVTQVTDAKGGITNSTYDGNGNVLTVTDPNIHTTTYAYDALDRRISTTLQNGKKWTYTYDANGNVLSKVTPTGEKTVKTYDPLNRMITLTEYAANGATVVRNIAYAYDANSNVRTEKSGANTISYTYDKINRIISVTDQYGKTIAYAYDKAGNRSKLTYPGNKIVSYVYDKNNRLKSLTDWLNKSTTYSRNFAGQVMQIVNGNRSKATYTYDLAGRLTNLTNLDGAGTPITISSHAMTLDETGNITQSTMNLPLLPTLPPSTGTMSYDTSNRLTTAGANSFTFDVAGRTITETKAGVQTAYHFDINDHITSITQGATTLSSYGYDLKNNRISQTQSAVETRYVIDQLALLSNVIAETNNLGTISNYYIYGEGLVSQISAASVSHYYHYDPTGNTLALTDATGKVTDTFAYAPYGFTTSTGTTHNPFKFVGRYGVMDDGNGLHYMRARYYKEDIKRFVSLDVLHGDVMTPQKLNRYAYVLGNPISIMDRSGFSGELAIYSNSTGTSSYQFLNGHSWISYLSDKTERLVTWGTWGMDSAGKGGDGLNVNRELGMVATTESVRTMHIDDIKENKLIQYISTQSAKDQLNRGSSWRLWGPCSTFAARAWFAATGEWLNPGWLYSTPSILKESILQKNQSSPLLAK